jgi:hypothetical protein
MITTTVCAKLSKRERVPSFLQSSTAKKLQQQFIMPKFFWGCPSLLQRFISNLAAIIFRTQM